MEAKAIAKNVRMTPRKARLVADLIRNKKIEDALNILRFTNKKSSPVIEKVLKSAIANAVENHKLDREKLIVSKIFVDAGPIMKRMMPRAMGRGDTIHKKISHVTVVVSEKKEG